MNIRDYGFQERYDFSEGFGNNVLQILNRLFPLAWEIKRTNIALDKQGADYVIHSDSRDIFIDAKIRTPDYKERGKDDVALEVWSKIDEKIKGWTRDENKIADYILWFWKDTGRYWLVDFFLLRAWFTQNWDKLLLNYPNAKQNSGTWKSECIFIPRQIIIHAIKILQRPKLF